MESPNRHRKGKSGYSRAGSSGDNHRRRSRDRSRDRSERSSRRRDERSRSVEKRYLSRSADNSEDDLYNNIINENHSTDGKLSRNEHERHRDDKQRERERERRRERERERDRGRNRDRESKDRHSRTDGRRSNEDRGRKRDRDRERDRDRDALSEESDESTNSHYYNKVPSNTVIVLGLQSHITEADIMSTLIRMNMAASSIRLIRKRNTGASRGFAFVEFNTVDEAQRWMELTQGLLTLTDNTRAALEYSHRREQIGGRNTKSGQTDWFCGKCGVFNFKRRGSCFKCLASREESETGGEGSDEISNILTKKIMLRNLDALTNEEAVLTAMQQYIPDLAAKINKILISRDALTQTSRGICYLSFDSLIDSMNVHNALSGLETPLKIDGRDVMVSYCIDHENKQIVPKSASEEISKSNPNAVPGSMVGPLTAAEIASAAISLSGAAGTRAAAAANAADSAAVLAGQNYTLADVPRLAQYSAAMYASTPIEHAHYLKYYTDYYVDEINKRQTSEKSKMEQVSANSGAAVALTAIQRKQKKMNNIETTASQAAAVAASAAAAVKAALAVQSIITPKGNDGKIYPTPDVSQYQYDETSGYYYDPSTGLYYDAHSQYYYNNETGAYLYWDQKKSTYILATPANAQAAVNEVLKQETDEIGTNGEVPKNKKKDESSTVNKHDKVKVAKKIVKDMEKWAKQLNQKKDYTVVATPQPILNMRGGEDAALRASTSAPFESAYADVGFSILEKKERNKLTDYLSPVSRMSAKKPDCAFLSDSDEEQPGILSNFNTSEANERELIDYQRLTCLLCKRAFQSLDVLQKHIKLSNLHKENLQKHNLAANDKDNLERDAAGTSLLYRDRAKERRKKYGECDPPPPNRSRERFETEIKSLNSRQTEAKVMPIGSNNVGNRLLQKMGWSEGQGLGRQNQGRTNIVEADTRGSTAGLGAKSGAPAPGDDYKTYVKKMMKSRYESV